MFKEVAKQYKDNIQNIDPIKVFYFVNYKICVDLRPTYIDLKIIMDGYRIKLSYRKRLSIMATS